jgi:hypothetical protein
MVASLHDELDSIIQSNDLKKLDTCMGYLSTTGNTQVWLHNNDINDNDGDVGACGNEEADKHARSRKAEKATVCRPRRKTDQYDLDVPKLRIVARRSGHWPPLSRRH